jgi:hypothetical protein
MAGTMLNTDDVLGAAADLLEADATLRGASYLTSAGRVDVGRPPSSGAPLPRLQVDWDATGVSVDGYVSLHSGTMKLLAFAANIGGSAPDRARLNAIIQRASVLLDGATLTVTGQIVFRLYKVSEMGCLFDEEAPEEHYKPAFFGVHFVGA